MRWIAGLLLCAFTAPAFAETKTVTWVNATKNTDETDIPATGEGRLVRTVVEYGTRTAQGGFGTKQGEIGVAAPATTLQLNLVVVQEYALRAFHCNTYAGTTYVLNGTGCSAASNVYLTTVAPPKPAAPESLTVAADLTAWTIVQSRDRVALVAVGTVAPGTQCDSAQPVLDKWVVSRAAVTFAGSVRPEVVLASCG